MIEQYSRQAGFLLDEGALPEQVDQAIEKFGFAMGPFRMGDLAGNDIGWAIRKRRAIESPRSLIRAAPICCAKWAASARRRAAAGMTTRRVTAKLIRTSR
jgi:3-hydroxyacyl-CoA dehydrogenase